MQKFGEKLSQKKAKGRTYKDNAKIEIKKKV